MSKRIERCCLFVVLTLAIFSVEAAADPVTYTLSFYPSSMTLGGIGYVNTTLTFTLTGDTTGVGFDQPNYYFRGPATFAILGGPSGTVSNDMIILAGPSRGDVTLTSGNRVGSMTSTSLVGYDLASSIVVTSSDVGLPRGPISTSLGSLVFSPASFPYTATFTATVRSSPIVPEPSSLLLIACGIVGPIIFANGRESSE